MTSVERVVDVIRRPLPRRVHRLELGCSEPFLQLQGATSTAGVTDGFGRTRCGLWSRAEEVGDGRRRSGYASALTIRAATDGLESGATFAWLQSTPAAASVYRRIGFRQVDTHTLLSRP